MGAGERMRMGMRRTEGKECKRPSGERGLVSAEEEGEVSKVINERSRNRYRVMRSVPSLAAAFHHFGPHVCVQREDLLV